MKQRVLAVFKYTVYALLIINVALLFRASGTDEFVPYKAIDQIGWLILLGVFEWETRMFAAGGARASMLGWPLAVELSGYAMAVYALGNYWHDRIWLDVGNAIVWLAISAMIWVDLLWPVDSGSAAFRSRSVVKLVLYAATFTFAILWGIEGAALDFYDAALWILCFFVIELNILRFEMLPSRRLPCLR